MKYNKITGNIYTDFEILTGRESLFCKAFFGHKATKNERAKIQYIWKRLLKLYKLTT